MRKFYGTAYTDVGTVKTVNQDSLMIRISAAGMHETAFAVVCDGMGGLQQGELASATVVRACENGMTKICHCFWDNSIQRMISAIFLKKSGTKLYWNVIPKSVTMVKSKV